MNDASNSELTLSDGSEPSSLIKKQLQVAKDIQLLSGNQLNQDDAMLLSSMYQSEYFKSVDSLSKAITRVVFGKMIGIDVATALTSLYIIDGKPGLESKAIRNTLNMAGYSIVTEKLDDKQCVLDWSYKGQHLGKSSFTIEQAVMRGYVDRVCASKPGWPFEHDERDVDAWEYDRSVGRKVKKTVKGCACKENWKAMPRNMLVARATSEGNNQYGNRAFKQEVYDVDELIDSPFREDTSPVDVARDQIKKAKTLDELQQIMKTIEPEMLDKVIHDINERTKEIVSDEKSQRDTSTSASKK